MGMGKNLRLLELFCQLTRLSVQPRKCYGFFTTKDMVNDCLLWQIGGSAIHMIEPAEVVCYLVVGIDPEVTLWHRI